MNEEIKSLLPKLREYLMGQPVVRAWLFGSCSRGEETPTSDIDILVEYDKAKPITLFTVRGPKGRCLLFDTFVEAV